MLGTLLWVKSATIAVSDQEGSIASMSSSVTSKLYHMCKYVGLRGGIGGKGVGATACGKQGS